MLDPYRGYAAPLRTLPNATVVVDAFHVVRLGFAAVDDVRRRVQQDTTGHRGRARDPLYRIRRTLRRGAETLTQKSWSGRSGGDDGAGAAGRHRPLLRAPAPS